MPKKIAARRSAIHGNGVFAVAAIAKGERVIQYKGRLRTHAEVDAGESGDADSGHTFLFTLNDAFVIDANFDNNDARWINHSCAPNCEAVLDEDDDDDRRKDRVFIEAIRAIKTGEELTYDYGITLDEPHTARLKKIWECRCGARNCTGTMLKPKRKPKTAKARAAQPKGARSKGVRSKGTQSTGLKSTASKQGAAPASAGTRSKAAASRRDGAKAAHRKRAA